MRTALLVALLAACLPLHAQWREKPQTGSPPDQRQDRTVLQGQVATSADVGVRLIEPDTFARQRTAVVEVSVKGLELDEGGGAPNEHQGHIVYRADNGPETTTIAKRFQVPRLAPGEHTVSVHLADSQGHAISPEHLLRVRIPK